MSGARAPAFAVLYRHRGFAANVFMTFRRSEKLAAFECLRTLSRSWPNTEYWLRHERRSIARIERGELHRARCLPGGLRRMPLPFCERAA